MPTTHSRREPARARQPVPAARNRHGRERTRFTPGNSAPFIGRPRCGSRPRACRVKMLRMELGEAIVKLREHEADLKQLGFEHLYLFGSTVRGEAGQTSDVDLFFYYKRGTLGL